MVRIIKEKCSGCGNCVDVYPFGVLEIKDGKAIVKGRDNCRKCGACINAYPNYAIKINDKNKEKK
jgi:NAD-dependent dihydropyrimidine dehydrogenase PreA subunit